jgi:8-oxo-dGTP pyrophosphatase MutT (NUDIX family)
MVEPPPGPAQKPNHGTPATPRPAASVVLLRRGGKHAQRALEVLLLKRTEKARFMPGVWVFPGGSVEDFDGEGTAGREACARRELGEEAGIDLPAEEELVPFCRWITPAVISRRFDAWFFLALAPAHTPPKPDLEEVTEARWFEPAAAIAASEGEDAEVPLAFPTRVQLTWLAEYATSDAALAAYRDRPLEPIEPRIAGEGDERLILLPGEPGYDDVLPETPGRPS